ncbi:MAG: leucine-rich repeat domain-containing protein [Butyrivibrio sp.]|nr:leucine-rich repeat domain-containing protein [Butyrivibrio sp.]
MNKRLIAMGLAGALSVTAALSGIIPTTFIGNDVSTVYASVTTKVTSDGVSISFAHEDPSAYSDYYVNSNAKSTIGINEQRAAIVSGGITTATTDSDATAKYIDEYGRTQTRNTTYTYRKLALADFTDWKSSNTKVATVANGVVTGVSEGYSRITASYSWVDETGATKTNTVGAYIYVKELPAFEYEVNEVIDLYVGDSYTMGAPVLAKGTTYDPSTLSYYPSYLGPQTKYDEKTKIGTGAYATYDGNTNTITANACGSATVRIYARDDKRRSFYWTYTFHIINRVGSVVTDDYGKAQYRILPNASDSTRSYRVAFVGFINTPKKAVVPHTAVIGKRSYEVAEIAENAFNGKGVTSVRLPSTIKKIGKNAFHNCKKLTSLDLSDTEVTKLDDGAISGCKKLKELIINGNKLKKFGKKSVSVSSKTKIYVEASSHKVYKNTVKKIKAKKVGGSKASFVEQD